MLLFCCSKPSNWGRRRCCCNCCCAATVWKKAGGGIWAVTHAPLSEGIEDKKKLNAGTSSELTKARRPLREFEDEVREGKVSMREEIYVRVKEKFSASKSEQRGFGGVVCSGLERKYLDSKRRWSSSSSSRGEWTFKREGEVAQLYWQLDVGMYVH